MSEGGLRRVRSYGWARAQALERQARQTWVLFSCPPRSIPTIDLLPGAGTAEGFNTVQAGALGGRGEEDARKRLRLFSILFTRDLL